MPPTCRVRLISFDGGGSRCIAQLEFVDALQNAIGLDYPIQEHFDFGIGTSAGQSLARSTRFRTNV
jgi:patatin-like phospholipase/acyl hydrolase